MLLKRFFLSVLLIFSSAAFGKEKPTQVVAEFYKWAIRHDGGGLPNEAKIKSLKAFLSIDLIYLLHASLAAEERCVAQNNPAEYKPSIFEGSVFVGMYEGASRLVSLSGKKTGDKYVISARLQHGESTVPPDKYEWVDSVVVIQEKGRWVIDDFWSGEGKLSLAERLKKYISKNECGL